MLVVGVIHALVVSRWYHLGSFDDDSSYVLAARAIASGHGLTTKIAGGYPLIGVYPPGYPALLSPLVLISRTAVLPLRAVSLAMFIAIFALTWRYFGRRGVSPGVTVAALALLALNPVLATYATMVMPETSFVVALLLLLIALDRWEHDPRVACWSAAATVVVGASILWLKEAGLGVMVGVVAWLLLRRLWRKALVAAAGQGLLIAPLFVARVLAGANLIGSRYSSDLGGAFQGGLVKRFVGLVPSTASTYFNRALPNTIVPGHMGLLPYRGTVGIGLAILTWTAAPLVIIGFVVWWRRYGGAACVLVLVYLAETLVYPFTNQRRVVLVLPLIVAWYVLGALWLLARAGVLARRWHRAPAEHIVRAVALVAALLVLFALASQFERDYLYGEGHGSSDPGGSPYMALLDHVGTPDQVVETDYLWTTALFSGHRTLNGVYEVPCNAQSVTAALRRDDAGFVLTADLNGGGLIDDNCLLPVLTALPDTVRLYRADADQSSVFELMGSGTDHPDWQDLAASVTPSGGASQPVVAVPETRQEDGDQAGQYETVATTDTSAAMTWSWPDPVSVDQLSLGAAGVSAGSAATTAVTISVRNTGGTWRTVAIAPGAVGPGDANPYLLAALTQPQVVTGVRVTVATTGPATVAVHYFHALGTNG